MKLLLRLQKVIVLEKKSSRLSCTLFLTLISTHINVSVRYRNYCLGDNIESSEYNFIFLFVSKFSKGE